MIRELVKDEAVLSQACDMATAEDAGIAADLAETLQSLENAACLAANQIGETKRIVAYLDDDENVQVIFNPALKRGLYPSKVIEECLSLAGETKVTRFGSITIAYEELVEGALVSRTKKFEGWTAQILQHMIDHCKGKLI